MNYNFKMQSIKLPRCFAYLFLMFIVIFYISNYLFFVNSVATFFELYYTLRPLSCLEMNKQ